ncbi:hypothetical protein [Endozoicomonas sp. Mp262]|uniref:hypothetical protein n=1 Tax=Endozoicomonas sp. Mp262 TaxID=2919499 RepID=UPI0021D93228
MSNVGGAGQVGNAQGTSPNVHNPDPSSAESTMNGLKVTQNPTPVNNLNTVKPDSLPSDQSLQTRNVSEAGQPGELPSIKSSKQDRTVKPGEMLEKPGGQAKTTDSRAVASLKSAGEAPAILEPQEKAEKYIEHKRLSDGKAVLEEAKANLDKLAKHKFPKDVVVKMTPKGESEPVSIIPPDKKFLKMSREQQENLIDRAMGVLDKRLNGDLAQFECDDLDIQLDTLKADWLQQEKDKAETEGGVFDKKALEKEWNTRVKVNYESDIHVKEDENDAGLEKKNKHQLSNNKGTEKEGVEPLNQGGDNKIKSESTKKSLEDNLSDEFDNSSKGKR